MDDPSLARDEDYGKLQFGCEHYKRRCRIRAPCCNLIFTCRHCHNEAADSSSNPHVLVRQSVKQVSLPSFLSFWCLIILVLDCMCFSCLVCFQVICSICDTEQEVAQVCSKCGVKMGEYFCDLCKFFDDDTSKEQFHCHDCEVCRAGGRDNFFHCQTCGACYATGLRDNHICIPNSTKGPCLICYEPIDSVEAAQVLRCGHTIHVDCFEQMLQNKGYRCPSCLKSVMNMTNSWTSLGHEIIATPMHPDHEREVVILCNECLRYSATMYHTAGHMCAHCQSYNTRLT
ncbi:unnamed protein product [Thlaspi arvense]|uniref:Uncharacterized protein n=1 Tax=Thlaspi arvense TaxID=13288 RepID=A0AAU9S0Y0_THLAR|nr:unnamed protein product [Thlaspi arvense]